MERTRVVPGLILIVLGVLVLAVQQAGFGGEAVVAAIGVVFLVTYAVTRQYGFLVPGGILTGLGIGIIFEARMVEGGAAVLLGLGLGFVSIYVIDRVVHRMSWGWWPLIPGGVLTFIGLLLAAGQARHPGTDRAVVAAAADPSGRLPALPGSRNPPAPRSLARPDTTPA